MEIEAEQDNVENVGDGGSSKDDPGRGFDGFHLSEGCQCDCIGDDSCNCKALLVKLCLGYYASCS